MDTSRKNYPPRYFYQEQPVDVAMVQSLNALNQNLLRYASKRGSSMYIVTTSGVVAQTVTTASGARQFLATLSFTGCAMGRYLDVSMLVSVSAAARFRYWIGIFPPDETYISTTAELQAEQNYVDRIASGAVDNTLPMWITVRVPGEFQIGDIVSVVLGATNISGISATYNLYCAHEEWSS